MVETCVHPVCTRLFDSRLSGARAKFAGAVSALCYSFRESLTGAFGK